MTKTNRNADPDHRWSNLSVFPSMISLASGGSLTALDGCRFRNISARSMLGIHSSRTSSDEDLGRTGSGDTSTGGDSRFDQYVRTEPHNLDGRPSSPVGIRATYMDGLFNRIWDGNMLTVTTTHIKQGWIRRENIPASDEVTLIEHYIRHGNMLTHVSVTDDPVYLAEPLVKSEEFALNDDPGAFNPFWPCEYIEEGERPRGEVPSYLPGDNPWIPNTPQRMTCHRRPPWAGSTPSIPSTAGDLNNYRRPSGAASAEASSRRVCANRPDCA